MADQIQRNVRRFTWANPSGERVPPFAGMTPDEVNLNLNQNQGIKAGRPEVGPMATRGPTEFLTPSTTSESLRLAVPQAANPYATPTGPRHDFMMTRNALKRFLSPTGKAILSALKSPPSSLSPAVVDQMRASCSREQAMMTLLGDLQNMQELIYSRIVGRQDA